MATTLFIIGACFVGAGAYSGAIGSVVLGVFCIAASARQAAQDWNSWEEQ